MPTKKTLVSIIIPVYNGARYLAAAIDSVLNQTYDNWELIIVNDASTDNTKEIANQYLKQNKKIRLFNHTQNKYRAGALNTGINHAKGSLISFLDADDIYLPEKTAKQVQFLNRHPRIDMVYSNMKIFDELGAKHISEAIEFEDDPLHILKEISEKNIEPNTPPYKFLGYQNNYKIIPGCSVLIRKKVFKTVSFDEKLKTCQDYDLWFQMIGRGYKIAKLAINSYLYRHHEEQISRTKSQQTREESNNLIIHKLKSWVYFKIPGKSKPKILLVPNIRNWAFDFEADQLIKNLSERFEFTKKFPVDFFMGPENYSKYDKIFVFFWPGAKHFLNALSPQEAKDKLILGVFSFNSWDNRKREAEKIFSRCRGVVVNDKKLFKIFRSKKYQTYFIKKWVDDRHFSPKKKQKHTSKLIVGWAGNPNHVDEYYKGYWHILRPVCEANKSWLTLRAALQGRDQIPYQKMPDFYNTLDVITCLSKAETGPNALLEAGACGIPAISTKVGLAPELIKNNWNGLLIKRNKKALLAALKKLHTNRKLLALMGKRTRREILKNWICAKNIKPYGEIFK